MQISRLAILTLSLAACPSWEPLDDAGTCPQTDMRTPNPADMVTPSPKCAAAEGLKGDNLLCVDFKDVQMLSSLSGWDFATSCAALWTTTGGKLQINNFSTFMSTCSFTMPAVSAADYQKYSRFTLAVVHTVDINSTKQSAGIYLSAPVPAQAVAFTAGTYPRQQTTITIAKSALPNGGNNNYQPLFQITSTVAAGGTAQGWQIESIAIQGIQ